METDWLLLFRVLLLQQVIGSLALEVRTGVVPIFSNRATEEPITFTFTTPNPHKRIITEFPVKVDTNSKNFPTLRPERYNEKNSPWETLIEIPNIDLSMPIINQAQYFRALQKAGIASSGSQELSLPPTMSKKIISIPDSPIPSSPKIITLPSPLVKNLQKSSENLWKDIENAWDNAKGKLADTGAMGDWRNLWEKLTGALEPFLLEVGERVGKAINRAMRQQAGVTWKAEAAKPN